MFVSLGGVTVGDRDHDLMLSDFEPSFGDVRVGDVEWPLRDGSRPGADYLEAGTITLTLRTRYGIRTRVEADQATAEFMRAWRSSLRAGPGAMVPLVIGDDGWRRVVYGRAGRVSPPVPGTYLARRGFAELVAEFRVLDPLVYDPSPEVLSISVVPESLGGIIAPIVTPVTTTMTSGVEYRMLTVGGEGPAPLAVTFHGPSRDPRVLVGGVEVGVSGTLAYDEDVTVDGRTRSVTLSDGSDASTRLSRTSRLDRLSVVPGTHEIGFTATDRTGTARVTVEATPTHYHL